MEEKSDISSLRLTLILYIVIFGMKLTAYFYTGVMGLLAESLHTLSDIFVAGFLLVALLFSRRKPDDIHRFGYGRAQNVGAMVAATLFISFTSFELYKEAIPRLFSHETATYQNLNWAIATIVVSMLIAAAPLVTFLRQKTRGAAAKAQMMELINDELGLLAALLGTLCIVWGFPLGDPLAAIAVATIIAINAVGLFRENLSMLIGRSPDRAYMNNVKKLALAVEGVQEVHNLQAEYIGPDQIHMILHIRLDPRMPVVEANRIAEKVERAVQQIDKNPEFCTVHVDPGKEIADEAAPAAPEAVISPVESLKPLQVEAKETE
jgi:ferrous-iron efflux pump FieF